MFSVVADVIGVHGRLVHLENILQAVAADLYAGCAAVELGDFLLGVLDRELERELVFVLNFHLDIDAVAFPQSRLIYTIITVPFGTELHVL